MGQIRGPRGQLNRLSVTALATLEEGKEHHDGGGLYLSTKNAGRCWVFKYTFDGKPRQMGFGALSERTLKRARAERDRCRELINQGIDPKADRDAALVKASEKSFGQACDAFMERYRHGDRWRRTTEVRWANSLALRHCLHIRELPISKILKPQVLECLEPKTAPHEQEKLRMRIHDVLKEAIARGEHPGPNPADKDAVGVFLTPLPETTHRPAMDWRQLPAFIQSLKKRPSLAALALEFQILTCSRPKESREAQWEEFNFDEKLWVVPASRMKTKEKHRVPLSPRALEILAEVRAMELCFGSAIYVFASSRVESYWSGSVGLPITRLWTKTSDFNFAWFSIHLARVGAGS